ncbi:hypothetical protein [Youngiibacter fragilis]|uniref:Uncharacterized protein n=1 Tax=Youngiibacter fragilis 232.1 TaxID=994573 RepID=V7I5Z3_9CLOT|nr:hypothetical protein [Youngiibacter fragilis]ETA80427.1 hypothetical protein T472_0211730 [Youngiibacter fragilis 232.1]
MDNIEISKVVCDLVEANNQYFMKTTVERLSKITDYELFLKEIALLNCHCEYRRSRYSTQIMSIWYELMRNVNRDVWDPDGKVSMRGDLASNIDYLILNDLSNTIKEKNKSFVEAWEMIRREVVDGEYSWIKHIDKIGY